MNNKLVHAETVIKNDETFGEIITDGYYAKNVAKQMKKNNASISDDAINNVFSNAVEILNQCPNPKNKSGEFRKTGIVIGKVQSGKTSNFIALLALAFDNGYNLAIVIGGNTNELLNQNVERIQNTFNVDVDKLNVYNSNKNNDEIEPDKIKSFIEAGRKIIIVTLKSPQVANEKHMTRVSKLFDDYDMSHESTIIIDDEGDQATLNANVYSKDHDLNKHLSQTYKVALELKEKIKRNCFISITATPQANLLIQTSDKLSPDFGQLIEPGEGYCGLSVFHGDEQDKFVKVIPDNDDTLLEENSGIPKSFCDALAAFYVGNAIRKCRGDDNVHSMLIHPSVRKFDHEMVRKKVDDILSHWRDIIKNGKTDLSYQYELKRILIKQYDMYIYDGVKTKSFEEIEDTILRCIKSSSNALVFNSDNSNARSNATFYKTRIYLGGAILDRGITIDGLTITYITRRAKGFQNVDNTEQRARWFGYKNVPFYSDYIDLCRVWARQTIKDDFASINESDEEMWSSIDRNLKNGVKFKDIPRKFLLRYKRTNKLRLTRPNVARTKDYTAYSSWQKQEYFINDKNTANNNFTILENFRKTFENKGFEINHGGENINYYIYDVAFKDFIENVLKKYEFDSRDDFNYDFVAKLYNLIETCKLDKGEFIDLCFVRYKWLEERRSLNDDLSFAAPFYRGRDLKKNDDGIYEYEGDKSVVNKRSNKIQIQIHYVKAKNKPSYNYLCPVICLYVPDEYSFKLAGPENE